jgi:cyanophycin synthetase
MYRPALVATLELDDLAEKESTDFPGFTDRLLAVLPGLRDHHCAKGEPGGFVERLREGTYFGHVVEQWQSIFCCLPRFAPHKLSL